MVETRNRNHATDPTARAKVSSKTARTIENATERVAKVSIPEAKPLSARDCGLEKPAQKNLQRTKRWQLVPQRLLLSAEARKRGPIQEH